MVYVPVDPLHKLKYLPYLVLYKAYILCCYYNFNKKMHSKKIRIHFQHRFCEAIVLLLGILCCVLCLSVVVLLSIPALMLELTSITTQSQ